MVGSTNMSVRMEEKIQKRRGAYVEVVLLRIMIPVKYDMNHKDMILDMCFFVN